MTDVMEKIHHIPHYQPLEYSHELYVIFIVSTVWYPPINRKYVVFPIFHFLHMFQHFH